LKPRYQRLTIIPCQRLSRPGWSAGPDPLSP